MPASNRSGLAPVSSISSGARRVTSLFNGLTVNGLIQFPQCRRGATALDLVLSAIEPAPTAGVRCPILPGSTSAKSYEKIAQQLAHLRQGQTHEGNETAGKKSHPKVIGNAYKFTQAPSRCELREMIHFRFQKLNNFSEGPWIPGRIVQDPTLVAVCAECSHPSIDQVWMAMDVVYQNVAGRGGNCLAVRHTWNRNIAGLRKSFGGIEVVSTVHFDEAFKKLIEEKGVLEAVCYVLERAFELERFSEFIEAALGQFKLAQGSWRDKGELYGDHSPNMVFLADDTPNLIVADDWAGQAKLSFGSMDGLRQDFHNISAPEGDRWHSILGHSSLSFIMHYLFQTAAQFSPYLSAPDDSYLGTDSCFFRLALNILAHIDKDEAQAHLVARVSHSKAKMPLVLERELPQDKFDLFSLEIDKALVPGMADPDWANGYVKNLRQRDAKMMRIGLLDETKNPFARAFYFPDGWSRPYITATLCKAWEYSASALNRLSPHYVSRGAGGNSFATSKDETLALATAAYLVETPIPSALCRIFTIAPSLLHQSKRK